MSEKISILIIDDHPIVRDGLLAILGTQPDFIVVGEAASGAEALLKFDQLRPDVVLLDLEMPEMDGVQVLRKLRRSTPEARVVVFTAFDTDERILGAVQAGAKGYLLKGAPRNELFAAIRIVHSGGSLLQPVVASRLMDKLSDAQQTMEPFADLSPREQEVLELLVRGKQNKEIAAELFITERTVKFHISSILGKLNAGNRTEAVTIALQQGLVNL
ncbi:MAG: response regulator transcription factor [Candidatus Promineifilaceae bacterium]|nr:response regulator transcription factor [Candidatus Promineifilaceae bacterium]